MEFGNFEMYLAKEQYLGRTRTWNKANPCVCVFRENRKVF